MISFPLLFVLLRTVLPWHTSDNVWLVHHGC